MILPDIKNVLIFSDSLDIKNQLDVFFSEVFIQPYYAATVDEALLFVSDNQPDLVLISYLCFQVFDQKFIPSLREASLGHIYPILTIVNVPHHNSEDVYIKSISAGANDVLHLPCSSTFFVHKLNSFSYLYDNNAVISQLKGKLSQEEKFTGTLLTDNVDARNFGIDKVDVLHMQAREYRKDFYFCAQCPNGDINVLLGDFDGFDYALTFIAIPLAETFRTMTKKGFKLGNIITQMNQQLYELLPNDVYFSTCVMSLSSQQKRLQFFNAGAPDALLLNSAGNIKYTLEAQHVPLGILPHIQISSLIQEVDIKESDTLVVYTDGLLKILNSHEYDSGGLNDLLLSIFKKGISTSSIKEELLAYLTEQSTYMSFDDDITLVNLPCYDWEDLLTVNALSVLGGDVSLKKHELNEADWELDYNLSGKRLSQINPIPLLLNVIKDAGGHEEHWQNLYTILTELYENSLLHGILNIKAHHLYQSKSSVAQLKTQLIEQIETGFIKINIKYYRADQQAVYIISINDSGQGFDYKNYFHLSKQLNEQLINSEENLLGRGIELVRQLCEHLSYLDNGSGVEATYLCNIVDSDAM